MPTSTSSDAAGNRFHWKDVLIAAAWMGLVTGLLEGAGMLGLKALHLLPWRLTIAGVTAENLYFAPLFNLLWFGALGAAAVLAGSAMRKLPSLRICVLLSFFLLFLDLILLAGRLRHLAALILAAGLASCAYQMYRRREESVVRFWRKTLPWVAAVVLLVFAGVEGAGWWKEWSEGSQAASVPLSAPNIVVIVMDTVRADHLSIYGYQRHTSPHLEQLGQDGVVFENAISTSSWTLPSHASLLTGRYPFEHGAQLLPYDGRFRTLAEELRERGYRTGAVSANLLYFTRLQGFGPGFQFFDEYSFTTAGMMARTVYGAAIFQQAFRRLGYEDYPGRRSAEEVTQRALRWSLRGTERPFFLVVNYFDAHDPYLPPSAYYRRFSKNSRPSGRINSGISDTYPKLTAQQLQDEMDAYDGAIAYQDEQIGKLLEDLEKRSRRSTLLVIISDHGESFGDHGLMGHAKSLYRDEIQVLLIMRWPGKIPAGVRVPQPVSIAAIPATLRELTRAEEKSWSGVPSLMPLWQNRSGEIPYPPPLAEFTLAEVHDRGLTQLGEMKTIVNKNWQYIAYERASEELYDWVKDPNQTNNLAQTPEGQEQVRAFREQLRMLLLEKSPWLPQSQKPVAKARRQ